MMLKKTPLATTLASLLTSSAALSSNHALATAAAGSRGLSRRASGTAHRLGMLATSPRPGGSTSIIIRSWNSSGAAASRSTTTTKASSTTALRGGSGNSLPPPFVFDNAPFFASQAVFLGANLLGFVLSLVTTSQYHVDLLGTGAFGLAAIPSLLLANKPVRVQWSGLAVLAWSTKLAGFLLFRVIAKGGHDARLEEILTVPQYSAGFWTFSYVWGVLCSLSHTLGSTSSAPGNPLAVKGGLALFGLGLLTESLADYQKWNFKQTNPGQFCDAGVWSLSQHPNWFGNLLVWSGIFLMNASALVEPAVVTAEKGLWHKQIWRYRRVGLALLSPLFMWYLFNGQATGALLPDALEATKKRYGYGTDPAYTKYVDSTPLVIPNPVKWFSSSSK